MLHPRTIIVGLARCIAMVIIWNDLACGDQEAAAVLVALSSALQVIMFGVPGWFYLELLPGRLGLDTASVDFSAWEIALPLLVYFAIMLAIAIGVTSGQARLRAASPISRSRPRDGLIDRRARSARTRSRS
ncbi:hypothetical protein Lesp01_35350 [Lentzea sp. NBRC 102530]|nr:hypothetical protein Lesp01_35350 [Lentzea sp. NBRC 102530]